MNDGQKAGRPQKHRWVYLSIKAVRSSGDAITASPTAPLDAKRRALVKSIVSTSNRDRVQKIRVTFAPDERSATFTVKT